MPICKSCGAKIKWIDTSAGKKMPVNAEQVKYWQRDGAKGKAVTLNGEVISCDFTGDISKPTGVGYISHFSTCPNADAHRKGKRL